MKKEDGDCHRNKKKESTKCARERRQTQKETLYSKVCVQTIVKKDNTIMRENAQAAGSNQLFIYTLLVFSVHLCILHTHEKSPLFHHPWQS